MLLAPISLLIGTLPVLSFAEIVDFGSLDQYHPRLGALPSDIGHNTIWVRRSPGGFDIVPSIDVRDKVQGVLEGCDDEHNQCYNDVHEVLSDTILGLDGASDRRELAKALYEAFKRHEVLVDTNAMLVWLEWKSKQVVQELGNWIPDSVASDAGSLATARVATISAEGTAVVTITQTPAITKRQGTVIPSVTAVTAPKDNYVSGDLIACLDKGLASRIGELMDRSTHCKDGEDFDNQHRGTKRRSAGTLGQAICAAEAVAANAAPEGPFNDLLLLNPSSLPFGFADLASATAKAAQVVIKAVEALSVLSALTPQLAEQVAVYIFALALDKVYEGLPLGEENRIHATMVSTMPQTATATTTTTSTSTGCPDPTKTPIMCGHEFEECPLQFPAPPKKEPMCRAGKYQGCTCSSPAPESIYSVSPEARAAMIYMSDLLRAPHADCPMTTDTIITPIPATLFASESHNVSNHFCEQWHPDSPLYMEVDSSGNNKDPEAHLQGRTPPPSAGSYKDWDFGMTYTPYKKGKKCSLDCGGAFYHMSSACASNAGGVYMYSRGNVDVGCGSFAYRIHRSQATLREYDRICYKKSDFIDKGPIISDYVSAFVGEVCHNSDPIRQDDKSTFRHHYKRGNDHEASYQYNIWWKERCTLENHGPTEMAPWNPLGKSHDGAVTCARYMIDNYAKCNNGGVGGTIQVGCLVYEFKADTSERSW